MQHFLDGFHGIAAVIFREHVGQHFGVRFRRKHISFFLQFRPQFPVIFDDAVMHHGDGIFLVHMGMGVFVGRAAVSGPAGVADAAGSRQGLSGVCEPFQNRKPACSFRHPDFFTVEDSDPGGVIAPVFQFGKTVQNDGSRLLFPDIACNTAHVINLLMKLTDNNRRNEKSAVIPF